MGLKYELYLFEGKINDIQSKLIDGGFIDVSEQYKSYKKMERQNVDKMIQKLKEGTASTAELLEGMNREKKHEYMNLHSPFLSYRMMEFEGFVIVSAFTDLTIYTFTKAERLYNAAVIHFLMETVPSTLYRMTYHSGSNDGGVHKIEIEDNFITYVKLDERSSNEDFDEYVKLFDLDIFHKLHDFILGTDQLSYKCELRMPLEKEG